MGNNELIIDIIISQKNFDKLPRNEKGECIYNGNLNVSNNQLKKLPNNLKIYGYLDVSENQLKKLPNGLIIKGSLYCEYNQLTTLPNKLIINNYLYCNYNQLKELPDDLVVGMYLYCIGNKITKEIKSKIGGEIKMDEVQKKIYDRAIKINKLKEIMNV